MPEIEKRSPAIPGLSPDPATEAMTPKFVWDFWNSFRPLQSPPWFTGSWQDEKPCSLLLHRKKIQLLGLVWWEKYLTCTSPVVQLFVTLCYMAVKWSGMNVLLIYGQNWKITVWIETMSGECLLQLMQKVRNKDLTACWRPAGASSPWEAGWRKPRELLGLLRGVFAIRVSRVPPASNQLSRASF